MCRMLPNETNHNGITPETIESNTKYSQKNIPATLWWFSQDLKHFVLFKLVDFLLQKLSNTCKTYWMKGSDYSIAGKPSTTSIPISRWQSSQASRGMLVLDSYQLPLFWFAQPISLSSYLSYPTKVILFSLIAHQCIWASSGDLNGAFQVKRLAVCQQGPLVPSCKVGFPLMLHGISAWLGHSNLSG